MKTHSANAPRLAAGFTLIEVMVVILLLGIVIALVASQMTGSTAGARGRLLQRTATATVQNIRMIAMSCGTTTAMTGNPVPVSGKTMLDVVYGGETNVAAAYQTCYGQSNVRALRDGVAQNGTTWQAGTYTITATGGGTAKTSVSFANVPDDVVLEVARTYDTALTALAASNTTSDIVRYGAAANGARSMTMLLD